MDETDEGKAAGRRVWLPVAAAAMAVALVLIGQAVLTGTTTVHRIVHPRVVNGDLALISLGGGVDLMAANGFTHPWLTRADLARACHERCVTRDLEWTPDGSALELVLETRSKRTGLYSAAAGSHSVRFVADCPDGTCAITGWGTMRATTFGPDRTPGAMAPNQGRIAYLSTRSRDGPSSAELWTVAADGTDPILLYDFGCCFVDWSLPVWAPDGTLVAVSLHLKDGRLDTTRISIVEYPSSARLRVINGHGPLSWQRSAREE